MTTASTPVLKGNGSYCGAGSLAIHTGTKCSCPDYLETCSPLTFAAVLSPGRMHSEGVVDMNIRRLRALTLCLLIAFSATTLLAQFKDGSQSVTLQLPEQSQAAKVSQTVGLTNINISYHRPLVNNRRIFGTQIVPYGQVWRAGANENTVVEFTDPVTIEGQPLAKGAYGLHMIPNEDSWTLIFSKNSTSWGSFTYDQKEDALRVNVKPQKGEFHEALAYDFDQVQPDSAIVTLHWE